MWNQLTFKQLRAIFEDYQANIGWWAWLRGEQNLPCVLRLEQFIADGNSRVVYPLTDADKIKFIQVLANIEEALSFRPGLVKLRNDLWQNECSFQMRKVLCCIADEPQFTIEVLNALQRNSVPNPILPTQPVAPSETALAFVQQALTQYLKPQKSITPLYLRWCITMGETLQSSDTFRVSRLLEKLLKVPAPHDFWMDAICASQDPHQATHDYIKNAKELQQFSKAELEEIKQETNSLEAALIRLTLRSYPEIDKPVIRDHLKGVTIKPELAEALKYSVAYGIDQVKAIIDSNKPLELAKNLRVLKMLGVDLHYQTKLILLTSSLNHESIQLDQISGLSKLHCELLIDTGLNNTVAETLKIFPPDLLTAERCKILVGKSTEWFWKFNRALFLLANSKNEIAKIIDLLIASENPELLSKGSTSLIKAKLFDKTGEKLLVAAEKRQRLEAVSAALTNLAEGELLTSPIVDMLFRQVNPEPAPVVNLNPGLKSA